MEYLLLTYERIIINKLSPLNIVGPYKNNKTGDLYEVIEFAINATNAQDGQEMVIYKKFFQKPQDLGNEQKFVREKNEFFNKFTYYG